MRWRKYCDKENVAKLSFLILLLVGSLSLKAVGSFCSELDTIIQTNLCPPDNSSRNIDDVIRFQSELVESAPLKLDWIQRRVNDYLAQKNLQLNQIKLTVSQVSKAEISKGEKSSEIESYQQAALAIYEVSWNLHSLKKAEHLITAGRRPSFEDQVKNLQKLKMSLLIKFPLLANAQFEGLIKEKLEHQTPSEFAESFKITNLQKILSDSALQLQSQLEKEISQAKDFLRRAPTLSASEDKYALKKISNFVENIAFVEPQVTQQILKYNESKSQHLSFSDRKILCDLEEDAQKSLRSNEFAKTGSQGLLFALSLMHPSLSGSRSLITTMLNNWGVISAFSGLSVTFSLAEMAESQLQCKKEKAEYYFSPNEASFRKVDKCQEDIKDLQLKTALSAVTPLSMIFATAKNLSATKNILPTEIPLMTRAAALDHKILTQSGITRFEAQGGYFTNFELSKATASSRQQISELSEKYLEFTERTYLSRQIVTPAETKVFMESAREIADRSQFIIFSKQSAAGAKEIHGGVGIVRSHQPSRRNINE